MSATNTEHTNIQKLSELPVRERIGRAKAVPYARYREEYAAIDEQITEQIDALLSQAG